MASRMACLCSQTGRIGTEINGTQWKLLNQTHTVKMSKNFFSKKPFSRSYLFSLICRARVSIEHVKERNTSDKSNNPIDLLFL